jgi:hypothetical protein
MHGFKIIYRQNIIHVLIFDAHVNLKRGEKNLFLM